MRSQSSSVPLGPWIKGIQNIYDDAMTPSGAVLEANNVLIASDGSITPRAGYDFVAMGGHSLFEHNGKIYGIYGNQVCEFFDNGSRPLSADVIDAPVTWTVLNNEPVFTNHSILARISNGVVKHLGVEAPTVPVSLAPLNENSAAVAFVNADGEEGPLSPIFDSGTYSPPLDPTVTRVRVYKPLVSEESTQSGSPKFVGDTLYLVAEQSVGSALPSIPAVTVSSSIGRPADTMNKARMPGGDYARYWRGRLLVARGHVLYFSDPLRYGMYDRSAGFVRFEARIDFIEPVEGGVFVALRDNGVHFLRGETPEKWERIVADVISAQAGTSLLAPTAQMKLDMQSKPEWVAVWLTHKGFAIGLPSGNITYPQADLLSGLPLGTGSLYLEGDRLIALSQ